MLFILTVHIQVQTWASEVKLSIKSVYNVLFMDGFMMGKLDFVQVKTILKLDYDNKPMKVLNVEYNDDMGSKDCKKVSWKQGK